jgi:hypothetical protein
MEGEARRGRGTEAGRNATGSRGIGTGLRFVCSRSLTLRPGGELPVLCLLPSVPSGKKAGVLVTALEGSNMGRQPGNPRRK